MFVEKLTDESDDSVVGKSRIECTMHINSWAICDGHVRLHRTWGEIVGQGMVPFDNDAPSFDVPVTAAGPPSSRTCVAKDVAPSSSISPSTWKRIRHVPH